MKAEPFGEHTYGRPALSDEQVSAITREKTAAFARRALAAEGVTLVLAGDADPAAPETRSKPRSPGWTETPTPPRFPRCPRKASRAWRSWTAPAPSRRTSRSRR